MTTPCRTIALAVLAILALTATVSAVPNDNVGTSAFPFLKIPLGARAVSMGSAMTGLADDETALYYNPSGIVGFEKRRYLFEYHNYFLDLQSGAVGYVHPRSEHDAFGVQLSYLNYGKFAETDIDGNSTGEFSGGDLMFGVTYARRVTEVIQAGATVKFIYEKIQSFSASGVALDLGLRYADDRDRYHIGLALQNLGTQLSSLGEADNEKLPLTFRVGASARPRGLPFLFAADLVAPNDNRMSVALGSELLSLKPLYLRLGYSSYGSNFKTESANDSWAGIALGLGFDIRETMRLGYAFSPAADLGQSHRLTVTGGF